MSDLEIFILTLQIFLSIWGIVMSYQIWKLINHDNYWWVMSLGFGLLLLASLTSLGLPLQHNEDWVLSLRLLYLPLLIRIAFVVSTWRILKAALKEHTARVVAEKKATEVLGRIRELTERMKFDSCPNWDRLENKCNLRA